MTEKDGIQRRETKQKQIVLETVREHRDHPTADAIYFDVREKDDRISRGTVYRNLKNLCDEKEIIQIKVPGADRYDLRTDYHYHFICLNCSAVTDIPCEYEADIDKEAQEKTGNLIYRHRTVFEGLCPRCRKLKEEENKGK